MVNHEAGKQWARSPAWRDYLYVDGGDCIKGITSLAQIAKAHLRHILIHICNKLICKSACPLLNISYSIKVLHLLAYLQNRHSSSKEYPRCFQSSICWKDLNGMDGVKHRSANVAQHQHHKPLFYTKGRGPGNGACRLPSQPGSWWYIMSHGERQWHFLVHSYRGQSGTIF